MRAAAFTMLAPGSGPEQRTRLALQWRQISCEYGGVGRGSGSGVSLACSEASWLQKGLGSPGRSKAWLWEGRAYPVQTHHASDICGS